MTQTLQDHLFGPGPKRVLALDGGGTRGIITIAFLEQIETVLREQSGRGQAFRLSDYYDLVGGTSVGSLIATMIALGYSVSEIKDVFLDWAPSIFRKPWLSNPVTSPKFSSRGLKKRSRKLLKDMTLASPDLKTGLAVIAKRVDTGSAWVLTNNPRSKYWEDPADHSYLGNKHFRVADLLCASTAAPSYFKPKRIRLVPRHLKPQPAPGIFVDGGVSPYNNPSLMCLMLANMRGYGFDWDLGAQNLLITSIGTGTYRTPIKLEFWERWIPSVFAAYTLLAMMSDVDRLTVTLMQWMSAPKKPWHINSELEDLKGHFICHPNMRDSAEPLFSYHRYNVILEHLWLKDMLGSSEAAAFDHREIECWKELDRPKLMKTLYERVGVKAAERQVSVEDFPVAFAQ